MRRLIGAAGRRTAGLAAGLILAGGIAGGVLLTTGPAYADTGVSVAITGATQEQGFDGGGATLDVGVSVQPAPTSFASVAVTGAGDGCTAMVGASGTGGCSIRDVAAGTYTLTASYGGAASAGFPVTVAGAPSTPAPTPTGSAPVFSADSPPTSADGQSYSYGFQASGSPTYTLTGAPYWLSIDAGSGMVSGTIPDGTTSFSYSVQAENNYGSASAGPFTVFFRNDFFGHRQHHNEFVDISTSLSCPDHVYTGQRGRCTLDVTNDGDSSAADVTAQITLPYPQLRVGYCGYYYYGCSISGNTASEDLGTLYAGQARELTLTFTADSGYTLWGRHHGHTSTVKVTGSASSSGDSGDFGNFYYSGQREDSVSVAYVTVIPRGFWW